MDSFATDTQALVKFMMGKKIINEKPIKPFLTPTRARPSS
jgi:hypothetical protein